MDKELPYWLALSHAPKVRTKKKNEIIVKLFKQGKSIIDFFRSDSSHWGKEYGIAESDVHIFKEAKSKLPNYTFLVETLLEQGYNILPITSKDYSPTLKKNLKTSAPPIIYTKGNIQIMKETSIAIVGSRKVTPISLEFTDNVAKQASKDYKVVVSGFAKGVSKQALDSTLECEGQSIIVLLPRGIATFTSGFKKYYKQIISGDVLVLSTFHPKAPWSVQLAMAINPIIYGLASEIYVAESSEKGGTWSGVMDGLRKKRTIYVRKPNPNEKNANTILIEKGGIPVDENGNIIEGGKKTATTSEQSRENFELYVIKVNSEDDKLRWLGENLTKLDGTGIIYTRTRPKTETYSKWLKSLKIHAIKYHAGLDSKLKNDITKGLMENRWKAVISTNALGMKINKPDIRFIIHTQIPESPSLYYQEIGGAGRDGKPTKLILFYNGTIDKNGIEEDCNLPRHFIDDKRPSDKVREQKLKELESMVSYVNLDSSRMKFLCDYLGGSSHTNYKNCDNTNLRPFDKIVSTEIKQKLANFRENDFPELDVKSEYSKIVNGVASSYYGVTDVGKAICKSKSKYENGGDFPDFLLRLTLKAFRKKFGQDPFDLIVYVPPTVSGDLVKNFAEKLSKELQLPISHKLKKTKKSEPQKGLTDSSSKENNVKNNFFYEDPEEISGKNVILFDDVFDSGATIKEIGNVLTEIGANKIVPLVIAKTVSGT